MKLLIPYLILVNEAAFLLMLIDKVKAKKKMWRIPERVLLGVSAIGGSLGGLLGMQLFRHKTKHPQFAIGIPVMLVGHIMLLVFLYIKFFA
jgi:uncharacterized membrane protein YsdA (DUF1294 family)